MSQHITVGDKLIGDDGNIRTVLDTTSGIDTLYCVKQSDGISYTVNSKHTLLLKDSNESIVKIKAEDYKNEMKLFGYKTNGEVSNISVSEIGKGQYYGFLLDGNHNFILSDFTCVQNCSQMFCTDCHTAWDWNTERVVTGVIHNPHYYEFVNRNGAGARNHADIPCGGLLDAYDMRNMMSRLFNNNAHHYLFNIYQCVMHIQHYELRNHNVEDIVVTNRSLRIKYLLNEITDAGFKAVLQQAEKKRQKAIAFRNIYQMFVDVASDIFRQMYVSYSENRLRNLDVAIEFVRSNVIILNNLVEYFNENLQKIGKMYKCVYPGITPERIFTNNLVSYKARQAPQVEIHHVN
jgi:hypothetical protein